MNSRLLLLSIVILICTLQLSAQQANDQVLNNALHVLERKCNVCHVSDYPKNVFTKLNMDSFSKKIYKQVFVKEKMPKGDSIRLTNADKSILILWLKTQLEIDDNYAAGYGRNQLLC